MFISTNIIYFLFFLLSFFLSLYLSKIFFKKITKVNYSSTKSKRNTSVKLSLELLNQSFQFYKLNFKKILTLSWPFLLTPLFVKLLPVLPFIISVFYSVILFSFTLFSQAATIALILFLKQKNKFDFTKQKSVILKRFARVFVGNIYFVMYFTFPLLIGFVALFFLFFTLNAYFSLVVSVTVSLLALAGILYLSIAIAVQKLFYQFEIILNNYKIDHSFKLSTAISHKKLHTTIVLAWPIIVFFLLYMILGTVLPLISLFLTFNNAVLTLLTLIFYITIALFFTPLMIIYKYKLYNYLLKNNPHYKQQQKNYEQVEKDDLKHLFLIILLLLGQLFNAYQVIQVANTTGDYKPYKTGTDLLKTFFNK